MKRNIEVKALPKQTTLTIRTNTSVKSLPQVIGKIYEEIIEYLTELGEEPTGMPFVIYYNLDMTNLDVEIGFPVTKEYPDKDEIKTSKIPAEKVVSCVHKGPYKKMKPTYKAMHQWIKKEGYKTTGVAIEFYYNSPNEVSTKDLLTEIQLPIQ